MHGVEDNQMMVFQAFPRVFISVVKLSYVYTAVEL